MNTVFWDIHGVLFRFTSPGSNRIAAPYQQFLNSLKEVIQLKRPGLLTKGILRNHESIEFLGLGKFFHFHHRVQI
jgi:hypothetical protein